MYPLFRKAHKLFDKTTQWCHFMRNSIHCFSQSTLFKTHSYFEDPIEFFGENRSVVSWTSKISSLVRRDKPEEAIGLFKTMLLSEQRPNYVTILSIVRAVGASGFENMTRVIHGLLIKMGFESEMSVVTTLLGVYSSWDVEIVWKLFDQVPDKDMVLWNAMLSVCTKSGQYIEAFEIFREMQYNDVQPSHVSIVSILPACGALATLSFGKQIHGFSIKREYYFLTNVQNSLVDMYAKCGYLETSIQVFNRIENKDLVSWRTMIHGCIENKCPRAALNMFSGMQSCCFKPDEVIILDAIGACGEEEKFTFGMGLHGYILKSGFLAFVSVMTAFLQMYAKFGEIGSARILFSQIQKKDFIAWSAMISAYAQSGHSLKALDTFKKMQSTNEKPNEITFVSVLQGCSSMGVQELGESIHAHMTKAGYSSNAFLISALIDLYCKFGRIRQGKAIFDEILIKDLVCWSSMINGYGINGYGNEALETFSNMLNCGIKPNEVVFISLLSACSHCGLENEGWNWFYAMEKIYGITPKLAHYACMVDLLSRQGHVEDALEFVKSMPIEPDNRIWGALLAGCRSICGSIEIAEFVVEQLVCLDPENTSYYVVLSNLYAEQCRWEDVERMRKLVDKKGLRKETGYRRPAYYVVVECGTQVQRSKISKGNHKEKEIYWNQKFTFEFPPTELENMSHLKFKIMDKEYFTDGGFVGETIVYLRGLIVEGNDKKIVEIRPTPYNVVLDDDTYKGQIKIGLKFIPNKEDSTEKRIFVKEEQELRQSICERFMNLWRIPWRS
ncbi:unnamed protein product [Camellia sinensis]